MSGRTAASSVASRALSTASLTAVTSPRAPESNPSMCLFFSKNSAMEISRWPSASSSAIPSSSPIVDWKDVIRYSPLSPRHLKTHRRRGESVSPRQRPSRRSVRERVARRTTVRPADRFLPVTPLRPTMAAWTADEMPRLDGKTVVVTGANSGLGFEGTRAFAARGATVVMACRSVERAEEAADEIRADAGGAVDGDLDVRECDLASLDSVASFADGLAADYDAVDVLCNNAGVMAIPRSETADGFETQFGVNHLGHFALTGRLFDLLESAEGIAGV